MVGDPRGIVVIRSLVHDGVSYRSPDDTSYTRSDLVYSRNGVDLQVADIARIRGRWPSFELYFADPAHDIVYRLSGRAGHAHWVPDHIYSNLYSYVVFPDFSFAGTITVRGEEHEVSGIGGLDHVNGRNVASPSSPGVGFWHYDPVTWEGGFVSNALYFLGERGEVVVSSGVTTMPDRGYHPCERFSIEYLDVALGGANSGIGDGHQPVPRAWHARLEGSHGVLDYVARAIDVTSPDGSPVTEANVLFEAEGVFRSAAGSETALRGRGYNEFMGGALDPSTGSMPSSDRPADDGALVDSL
jgi:hypothetical protein